MSRFTWAGSAARSTPIPRTTTMRARIIAHSMHSVSFCPLRGPTRHCSQVHGGEGALCFGSEKRHLWGNQQGMSQCRGGQLCERIVSYIQCSRLDDMTDAPETREVSQQSDGQGTALQDTSTAAESSAVNHGTKKDRIKRLKKSSAARASRAATGELVMYPPDEQRRIRNSWARLMRWSRNLRQREAARANEVRLEKIVVFGGGSFGTAMGCALAKLHPRLEVVLLLRDPYLCKDINDKHYNTRYLPEYQLPDRVKATTSAESALSGAQYAIHAVPVQHSRTFLTGIKQYIDPSLPIISVSKGIEVSTGKVMSDLIPSALGRKQPMVFLSGPSFAKEVMDERPTGLVAASRDKALCREVQNLFASPIMRINITTDVIGVEICGALKNVLAIAAGIVEGLELGNNAMAALISQGCSEIRWLAEKMGAKPATISGLSGLGDIMLTCYGSLSRNRSVGVRLGKGEALSDIMASSSQVAEGVPTAGAVVSLARKYRVQLPVLTAVAQVLNGHLNAAEAVAEIMNLPQIEER